jgi:hypothetical protein
VPDSLDVEVVERLAGALGAPLTIGPQLSGSDRWIVVRATAGARALVIKHSRTRRFDWAAGTPEPNVTRFASERAALEFYAADPELAPLVPNLVLAHEATGTIVMDDLGVHPTLADVLLGSSRPLAEAQLRDLATLLGAVARRSSVRLSEFRSERTFPAHFALLQARANVAKLDAPPAVAAELVALCTELEAPGAWGTVGPADACPDNVLMTPTGLHLLDFEGATVYHALFDAATLTLPFPSCWCHDALPAALRAELLDRYCGAYGRDDVEDELARVSIVWSAWALTRHLGAMREADFVFRPELVTGRQRMRAAAQAIAAVAGGAMQDWAASLDAELAAAWGESSDRRPVYPPFSGLDE